MIATLLARIEIDGSGIAYIEGTRTKVAEVVMDRRAYGWSPEEIHFQHPHLTMSQIHAALAFYCENQVEIDGWIEKDLAESDQLCKGLSDPQFRQRILKATQPH